MSVCYLAEIPISRAVLSFSFHEFRFSDSLLVTFPSISPVCMLVCLCVFLPACMPVCVFVCLSVTLNFEGMTGGHSTGRLIKGNLCLTQLSLSLLTFFVGLVLWFPATSGLPDYEHEVIISNECRYRYQPRSDCVQSECRMTEQVLFGTGE